MKLGVIGTGRIGKVHTATLVQSVPQGVVVAIADVKLESANDLAKAFGITSVFTDYMDVINHPEVEAVINDLPLPVSGNDGLMSVAIAMAPKKSHLEHRPVKLSEIL